MNTGFPPVDNFVYFAISNYILTNDKQVDKGSHKTYLRTQ